MTKDPYRYFRVEARELIDGLTRGVLVLERGSPDPDLVARMLRLSHTLKGAARVVKQPEIAALAHEIEDRLASLREAGAPITADGTSDLLRVIDRITTLLEGLAPGTSGPAPRDAGAATDQPMDSLRVDTRDLDVLLRGLTESSMQVSALGKALAAASELRALTHSLVAELDAPRGSVASVDGLARARVLGEALASDLDRCLRALTTSFERLQGSVGDIHETAHRLRLIPAHTLFPALDRAVRDAAQALGKQVVLETHGGEVRLDAVVLGNVRDALMHVVRNAVTHGIETARERVAAGKPPGGRVELSVTRRAGRVRFACRDDGRGIDVEAVRVAAVERGLVAVSSAEALSPEGVLGLLGSGGITTMGDVTELSGRGIGLDVVRTTASRHGGEMRIRSEAERGATIEIEVPVSIASLQGLVVEAGDAAVVIPLDAVRKMLRVDDTQVTRASSRTSVLDDGQVIPFMPLERVLGRSRSGSGGPRTWSAVLVRASSGSVAVGIERVLGTASVVMQPLPELIEAEPIVSGACLDADGNPQLVLDPAALVLALGQPHPPRHEPPAAVPAPVLVIDDSLTTRMLEQSILESAGYAVELAVSAEEALTKARNARYSLFVVDVEMPGIDGFEFIAEVRSDPQLHHIPAILVTSRSAVEDRRRGEDVGASAYIVKAEFDQGRLLSTIRRLIG